MTWSTKVKQIALTSLSAQPSSNAATKGRSPQIKQIGFTPQELFGAMARCSHLQIVSPHGVTPESEMCRHLISQHVNDYEDEFSLGLSVKNLKDFSRTHMIGVVAAGLAYLQMVQDGYVWLDHFENFLMGRSTSKHSPDFVFSRPNDAEVAIMESKGTSGSSRGSFRSRVKEGYHRQIEPYLGTAFGGAIASHGYAIGSWMKSASKAELMIAHTAEAPSNSSKLHPGSSTAALSPSSIKRGNYITVLSLLFGPAFATLIRDGILPAGEINFSAVRWLDREWLLGWRPLTGEPSWSPSGPVVYGPFALELDIARLALRSLSSAGQETTLWGELREIPEVVNLEARGHGGAVFPDGFAVIGKDFGPATIRQIQWVPSQARIIEGYTSYPIRELSTRLDGRLREQLVEQVWLGPQKKN